MRFAALGRTKMLHDAVIACSEAGHELRFIATAGSRPEYGADEQAFRQLASQRGVPFCMSADVSMPELAALLDAAEADAAISVNWPVRIPGSVISRFKHGILNAHAGDLPRFRGNATPNWAILAGEREITLTIHQMAEELDAGPVLSKVRLAIDEQTYIGDVYGWLADAVPAEFASMLSALEQDAVRPRPQPPEAELASRCYPRRPGDGRIDWSLPAGHLARLVRATSEPFGGAFSWWEGTRATIWRARAEPEPYRTFGVPGQITEIRADGEVGVLTGDGLLVIEQLGTASVGRCLPAKLIHSTRSRWGDGSATGELESLLERLADVESRLHQLERR